MVIPSGMLLVNGIICHTSTLNGFAGSLRDVFIRVPLSNIRIHNRNGITEERKVIDALRFAILYVYTSTYHTLSCTTTKNYTSNKNFIQIQYTNVPIGMPRRLIAS